MIYHSTDRLLIRILIAGLVICFLHTNALSQALAIGSIQDGTARNMQLTGKLDSSISFTIRPLSERQVTRAGIYAFIDSTAPVARLGPFQFAGKYGQLSLLPVTVLLQSNTHHPYGWNDGAMIPAKGLQTLIRAGVYAALGPLEVQLSPEFIYAANTGYETNSQYGTNTGTAYQHVYPGQSSIRLSAGVFSAGLSTENLWWGPGRHSSLLMSNNAPGFLHGFFSSKKPAKTPIGSFEWQLIGGQLTVDNSLPFENRHMKPFPVTKMSRYLNAFAISYQPKWVPFLYLGMTRALQRYRRDITLSGTSLLNQYFPILTKPFQKQNAQNDDTLRTDQLASFFMRWVLPKSKAEFYIEYGFNDYNQNIRDYVMGPMHSAAYVAGFKKIITLKRAYLDIGFEMTQLSQTPDYLLRDAGNWYIHSEIFEGYTHNNQTLGAGAGFGTNVQSFTVTWIRGWKQLGILLERADRDPQYHADKWIDLSIGIQPQWNYKNMIILGKFQFINSSQYGWTKDANRFNMHSRLTIQYLF